MKYLNNIYTKLYYKFWNSVLPKTKCLIPVDCLKTKNIFIYFDYEREFGGHKTNITDDNIKYILALLEKYSIKTTWFVVGKIFEKYNESIKEILNCGHEIGSHSYNHISPMQTSNKVLEEDFQLFYNKSKNTIKANGFHSPRGRWSYKMFKFMSKYNNIYDVIGFKRKIPLHPYSIKAGKNVNILRFHTTGDDWPLYEKNFSENEVLKYFIEKINQIKNGEIAGLGFHPWILFSDAKILSGFIKFLAYLSKEKTIMVGTANYYSTFILKN